MKNKIIVTGGCGYIGSHTVIELLESNFEVVIFDDLSNSTEKTIDRISQITGKTPIFVKVDLKDEAETNKVFKAQKDALAVIHFAAHKAVGESVKEPLKYYQNNFYSLINSLSSQTKNNINNFIFSSSATVYGLPKTLPITEKNKTKRPFSPYGNTKKVAEEILEDLTNSDPNFTAISLRYFNPIGAHESGLIGELPTGIPNNLMPYVTQTAAGIREKLMVYGNDYPTKDGTPIRDYIHVVDLAKAHVLAVKRLVNKEQEKSFEYFNLGTGIGYSVLDIIKTFETVTNSKLNYEITSRREGDVPRLYAATKLATKKLGWTPTRELNEMISSSWKWEQNVRKEKE
ncbi:MULTISPECIES: UDP-glucose 4-epimerase GalE [unclassified Cellulophaga]|uniref:UDP-glucose 4-epimerase GalE n=1 Tax=unclassified Cellulophaga TaxID=2634405 RepID=UPI0026E39225|nr:MULTISPECIES: UDP-glucose 4-epimerase GalE [unclassified Cellulophaga]MDO6492378.1 UDP-glucose 4-epimerase GalE [Cellulophaga sp. 2_MG-2023]MDO6496122.1 UDP-glucose 4-epimerase GalE [Cellulophaga sp. 3_MG-2023]